MTRLTKWVTLRKQGLELVDPTEDGANLFQHYGDFNASIQGDAINAVNAILESLAVQADIVSGGAQTNARCNRAETQLKM
jgi:hypothetical protein